MKVELLVPRAWTSLGGVGSLSNVLVSSYEPLLMCFEMCLFPLVSAIWCVSIYTIVVPFDPSYDDRLGQDLGKRQIVFTFFGCRQVFAVL